jgi:hypothetical protein
MIKLKIIIQNTIEISKYENDKESIKLTNLVSINKKLELKFVGVARHHDGV